MIKNFKRGIALLAITSTVSLNAQTMYKARVINKDTGEPIIGAVVRGQKDIEAVTDEDGFFSLNTNDDQTLHISYIGFKEQDIKAQTLKGQPTIGLIPGIDLQEVQVTASISSARSQKALGSKVDHIDMSNLSKNAHTNSLSDMLDGKVGGVQMYQSNGKVGMPIRFNMRSGATMSMERDPIIYVDGVKYNSCLLYTSPSPRDS